LREHPDHKITEISDPIACKRTGNGRNPTLRNTENTGPQGQLPTQSAAFNRQISKSQVKVSNLYDTSVTFSKTEPIVPFPWLCVSTFIQRLSIVEAANQKEFLKTIYKAEK
jgi:hypothetical protein